MALWASEKMAVGEARRRLDPEQLAASLRHVVKQGEMRKRHKRSLTAERPDIFVVADSSSGDDPYADLVYDSDSSDVESSRQSVERSAAAPDFLGPLCRQDDLLTQTDRQKAARRILAAANRDQKPPAATHRKTVYRIELWDLLADLFAVECDSFTFTTPRPTMSQCERSATRARFDRLVGGGRAHATPLEEACFGMGVFTLDIAENVGGLALMQAVQRCFPRDECMNNNVCTCVSRRGWTYRAHSEEFRAALRNR